MSADCRVHHLRVGSIVVKHVVYQKNRRIPRGTKDFPHQSFIGLLKMLRALIIDGKDEDIYWKYLDYEPARSYEIAQYFGRVSGYTVEQTPTQSGYAGYKDWFIQEYDRPGYTIETGMGENPLPMSDFAGIYRDNTGILLGGMTQI